MVKIKIEEADVIAVATKIDQFSSEITNMDMSVFLRPTAIKIIDSVLSLGITYQTTVPKRLKAFERKNPSVKQLKELAALIADYSTPYDFLQAELDFNSKSKANTLNSLVEYLCYIVDKSQGVSEEKALKQWAQAAVPQDCYALEIKGIKVAGFQWVRMLLGANTSKPDTHIKKFLSEILSEGISDIRCVFIMEAASKHLGLPTRKVDHRLWQKKTNWKTESC